MGELLPSARGLARGLCSDVDLLARGWRWGRRPMVPRSAEAYIPPREAVTFPTTWARTPTVNAARAVIQRYGLVPLIRREVATRVNGLDVLDGLTGPVVFVANHTSHLDTPLILGALPDPWRRRTAVAAAADYFFDTWWRAVGSALVFNTFPIERRGGRPTTTPAGLLREGWSLVVYPEGTRSPDGWVQRFRMGAAYLAAEVGVPVVPIGLRGSFAAMPKGRSWPRPGRPAVTIRFGSPVHPVAGEAPRSLAPRIEAAVARLLDEDASTWWQATRRAVMGTTPDPGGPPVARWRRVWEQTSPPPVRGQRRVWR